MDILSWILLGSLTVIFIIYVGYLVFLKLLSPSNQGAAGDSENLDSCPRLSIIVATYNEANVIRSKLENLNNVTYPKDKYEIIVVDSGSTDNTIQIVEEYRKKGVILLKQQKRLGKANALNFALEKASGDIIVLTDANAEFSPESLSALVKEFDGRTGAVLPRFVPCGKLSYWDKAFHEIHNMYKSSESAADSVFIVFGELFAFRRHLIDRIDEDAAADDLEIAMTIRKKGYRIKYNSDVEVKEKLPSGQKEVRIQKTRHIFGIIQAMVKNSYFFLNPRYGLYGMLIFPTHFLQMTLGPFLVFSSLAILLWKLGLIVFTGFPVTVIAVLITFSALSLLYLTGGLVKKVASLGYNFFATEVYIIVALINLMRGKKYNVWAKISSTRDAVAD